VSVLEATVIRQHQARSFMEGPEHCREYVRNRALWFGTSTVPPGQEGNLDPGHPSSVEVFYCCQGHVLVRDGERHYELHQGDALLIPEGLPHTIVNVGTLPALVAWAGAPGE
jgi:mannose-6-phosphate isomerase-like protein (cupin superfamily)